MKWTNFLKKITSTIHSIWNRKFEGPYHHEGNWLGNWTTSSERNLQYHSFTSFLGGTWHLSLTHVLFRIVFSFQVFGDVPVIFLLLICTFIAPWPENTLYDISSYKTLEICFMVKDIVKIDTFRGQVKIKCPLLLLGSILYMSKSSC